MMFCPTLTWKHWSSLRPASSVSLTKQCVHAPASHRASWPRGKTKGHRCSPGHSGHPAGERNKLRAAGGVGGGRDADWQLRRAAHRRGQRPRGGRADGRLRHVQPRGRRRLLRAPGVGGARSRACRPPGPLWKLQWPVLVLDASAGCLAGLFAGVVMDMHVHASICCRIEQFLWLHDFRQSMHISTRPPACWHGVHQGQGSGRGPGRLHVRFCQAEREG
jgi:hypothetical protein